MSSSFFPDLDNPRASSSSLRSTTRSLVTRTPLISKSHILYKRQHSLCINNNWEKSGKCLLYLSQIEFFSCSRREINKLARCPVTCISVVFVVFGQQKVPCVPLPLATVTLYYWSTGPAETDWITLLQTRVSNSHTVLLSTVNIIPSFLQFLHWYFLFC